MFLLSCSYLPKKDALRSLIRLPRDTTVKLKSRHTADDYNSATYSFRHLTRDDKELTRNNWELIFEGRSDFKDYFGVDMIVDDHSFIYDLGKRNCRQLRRGSNQKKDGEALAWLYGSEVAPSILSPHVKRAQIKVGHCYLTYNVDDRGRVIALFNVSSHVKNQAVWLKNVQVLAKNFFARDALPSPTTRLSGGEGIRLQSRYTSGGSYNSATYSFRHLTRDDKELTRNNWELLFEGRSDFKDYFEVTMVVDDHSFIYDLGKRNCRQLRPGPNQKKDGEALAWLYGSEIAPSNLSPHVKRALVKVGHCYLTYNVDNRARVIALFNVSKHIENQAVWLENIQVLIRNPLEN